MSTPTPEQARRLGERILAAARAFTADPNDDQLRIAYVQTIFNHDWAAAGIVAIADAACPDGREVEPSFVQCGPDLVINRLDVSSLRWDRRHYANGSESKLVIVMRDGAEHRLEHRPSLYGGTDAYEIERALRGQEARR